MNKIVLLDQENINFIFRKLSFKVYEKAGLGKGIAK